MLPAMFLLRLLLAVATLALPLAARAQASQEVERQLREVTRPADMRMVAPHAPAERMKYSSRYWQEIHFYPAERPDPAPLVVLFGFHRRSAGYSADDWLRYRLNQNGISLAIVSYHSGRPRPGFEMENKARAIAYLRDRGAELGIDPGRIVLAGGHDAALLGTNEAFLAASDVPIEAIRGVVCVNCTVLDIDREMARSDYVRGQLRRAYGREPEEYRPFSPVRHLAAPNAARFFLYALEDNEEAVASSQDFMRQLVGAGIPASLATFTDSREGALETFLFVEPGGAGSEVLQFIDQALVQ